MEEVKVVKKIKSWLARAACPRWIHQFGPKTYETWQHVFVLLVREACRLSYRKAVTLLEGLGFTVPTYSAVAKFAERLPARLREALLSATVTTNRTVVAAVDGAYFPRRNPSYHYLARTHQPPPLKEAVQLVPLLDTRSKQWLAASIRVKRVGETRDTFKLLDASPSPPEQLVADKAWDAEAFHRECARRHVLAHVPVKRGVHHGLYRFKHAKQFRLRTYHRRELIEAGFSRLKRAYGACVKNKKTKTIRVELTLRLVADNLKLLQATLTDIFNRAHLQSILVDEEEEAGCHKATEH